MNNYFILHGTGGSPEENWFPWLKKEIEKQGKECMVPRFPIGDGQSYDAWSKVLDGYLNNGKINESTIFIAHSISPVFVIKYILEKQIKVFGLVSISGFNNVATPYEEMNKILGKFFIGDEIKEINNHLRLVYCLYSDSDPYLKYDDLENFAKSVLAEKCVIHDGGHLNSESGYLRFDKLLEVIKQIDNGMDFDESDDMPIRLNFIVTNVRD